jgi:uncharacterized protein
MKVVVAGGSGFVGEPLVRRLLGRGDDVLVLTRNPAKLDAGRGLQWDGRTQGAWSADAVSADVVINLAGENVGEGRWTDARKARLISSRLDSTRALIEAMKREPSRKRVYIHASAVGLYGDRGDELLDENASRGQGFLAELVERWEAAAREGEAVSRLVLARFGVVLAPDGGALKKLLLPFRLGAGGPVGSGRQWMPWVDRDDVLSFIAWAIDSESVRGAYNVTAPEPVRNRDFGRALGRALRRPAILPAPAFALRLAFGQMADEALLASQRVVPKRAEQDGFTFASRTLEEALRKQL